MTSEFPPQPGGIGNHAYHLAAQLQKNDFHIKVITDGRGNHIDENRFDHTLNFKIYRVSIRRFRWLMYIKRFQLLFHLTKQAHLIIATGKFPLWSVALVSLFYNRKTIAIIHGTEVNFKRHLLKKSVDMALSRFSKIIAVSQYTKSLVAHIKKDVLVIPNGIEPQQTNLNSVLKINLKGTPALITVGNVTERKGQLQVIKHLPKALKMYPDLHYHCVGIPTEVEKFKAVASHLGVDHHVTFHGRLDTNELQHVLASSDVFVMLSNETKTGDVEGFGIAILEANLLGLPAIGSKNCGLEDAIHDNRSGILVAFDDTEAFIHALQLILKSKSEFSENSKSWALEHRWDLIIHQYIKAINQ